MPKNTNKPNVLVVIQLTGGNDFMNTIIPYSNPIYYDSRSTLAVPEKDVLPIDDELAFHPATASLKTMYDNGNVAIVQGIGYPNPSRSHFRAMDIWHTCEPEEVSTVGWLGQATKELDSKGENVLTSVNLGRGLPRALASPGVPVTSVSELDSYGLMTDISDLAQRQDALATFERMYAPVLGTGQVREYLARTGLDVIKGSEVLKEAPKRYRSKVEYANNSIAKGLRDVARVYLANLGTRIFYVEQGGYDTHAIQNPTHPQLLMELSSAISDFFEDLRDHNASEQVTMLVFTEFGRRMKDNGSGTDHGSGGGAFIIGDRVEGGLYSEYPSLEPKNWENGEDLRHSIDFRGIYGTLLEQWMSIEANTIVGGKYEQIAPFI